MKSVVCAQGISVVVFIVHTPWEHTQAGLGGNQGPEGPHCLGSDRKCAATG